MFYLRKINLMFQNFFQGPGPDGYLMKQLLAIIAKSVPFKPNMTSIGTALSASRNNITDYCLFIEEAGMIAQLRDATGGIRGLGKVDKIYLDNTNLIYSLANDNSNTGNIRESFFLNQLRVKYDLIVSPVADFLVGDYTFEVSKVREMRLGSTEKYHPLQYRPF